jgi:hypothetical protein
MVLLISLKNCLISLRLDQKDSLLLLAKNLKGKVLLLKKIAGLLNLLELIYLRVLKEDHDHNHKPNQHYTQDRTLEGCFATKITSINLLAWSLCDVDIFFQLFQRIF